MKILISKAKNNEFFFTFTADNGKKMGKETYVKRGGAINAAKVIINSIVSGKYKFVDKTKKPKK